MSAVTGSRLEPAVPVVPDAVAPFLSVRGVAKDFGDHTALHPTDLEVPEGEFLTLLGPSGCGKTTLLRIIAGLEEPTAGSVAFRGESLAQRPPERRPFNIVFQSYALFPHMDVGANVAYGLQTAGMARAEQRDRTRAMLDLVGLAPYATRRVSDLSGGQQQRVALARALVNEPEVLLLDEPLAALDLQLRKHLQEQLRSIHQRLGTTFIYVTHDQEEALKLSHRIALMCGGRLVQLGAPREIYERPASRFAAEFIGDSNLLEGVVDSVEPGRLLVRLPGGSRPVWLDWSGGPPPRPAEQILTSVRPECVLPADAGEAHMTGVVEDLVFVGAAQRYTVALPDRQLVMALAAGDADWPRGEIGLRVTRGVALPADPAG